MITIGKREWRKREESNIEGRKMKHSVILFFHSAQTCSNVWNEKMVTTFSLTSSTVPGK